MANAEKAYIVNVPQSLWPGALRVIQEFCGPTVKVGEFVEGDLSHPCITVGEDGSLDIVGHTSDVGPLGVRFWTHVGDLAEKLQGWVDAVTEDEGDGLGYTG